MAAIETGTFNRSAAILIRSGFDHRMAAISAVTTTNARFDSPAGMRQWINNLGPEQSLNEDWPTPETRSSWDAFVNRSRTPHSRWWRRQSRDVPDVRWYGTIPDPGQWLRVTDEEPGKIKIWSTGFELLGEASVHLEHDRQGVLRARRHRADTDIRLRYYGPDYLMPDFYTGG